MSDQLGQVAHGGLVGPAGHAGQVGQDGLIGQDNKPATDGENAKGSGSHNSDSIKIKVKDGAGMEVLFRVKWNTQMKKIKEKYCEKATKNISTIRFLFDGETLSDETTPKELEMEPEDIIEVVSAQTGGH